MLRINEINPAETRAIDKAEQAILAAHKTFATYNTSGFKYYESNRTVTIDGVYDLGAITVNSNIVTPTNAVWPSWMEIAHIRVGSHSYPVLGYSGSTLQTEGLADGTYTNAELEQLFVPLPQDFRRRGAISDGDNYYPVEDMARGILQGWQDYYEWARSSASPHVFAAVSGDERFQGELMLFTWPPYRTSKTLRISYERYPEPMDIHRYGTGECDVTLSTVTADDAIFTSDHVGSSITFCTSNDTEIRNSLSSRDLVYAQRIITGFTDANTVTIDESIGTAITDRTFYISDVADVMPGPMEEAFLRLCEYELLRQINSKLADKKNREFMEQLQLSMADDIRYRSSMDEMSTAGYAYGWGIGDVTGRPDL